MFSFIGRGICKWHLPAGKMCKSNRSSLHFHWQHPPSRPLDKDCCWYSHRRCWCWICCPRIRSINWTTSQHAVSFPEIMQHRAANTYQRCGCRVGRRASLNRGWQLKSRRRKITGEAASGFSPGYGGGSGSQRLHVQISPAYVQYVYNTLWYYLGAKKELDGRGVRHHHDLLM